jgi:molybdenum cofactor cytidylyltransferase
VIAAVVLAAGFSRRLGYAKQTIQLGFETLIARSVRVAREAGLAPVVVVVNSEFAEGLPGCDVVVNELAEEGMASSIRCGVERARGAGARGVVVMACDQVRLGAEHLRALCAEAERVTGSGYLGKVGIPAYFPAASFGELLELQGDVGARELLRGAAFMVDERLAVDVDTEEDLERARTLFGLD